MIISIGNLLHINISLQKNLIKNEKLELRNFLRERESI